MADLLAIYLNDHLAGAVAGAELAARAHGSNRDDERYGPPLERLAREVREDREALRTLIEQLGVSADRAKQLGAWLAEKLGRLKLNGQLLGYSPLSRVEELEALRLGVTGKRTLWQALLRLAPGEERLSAGELERLLARAEAQLRTIDECHAAATADAFEAGRAQAAASPNAS
jgi:hypothetical protein